MTPRQREKVTVLDSTEVTFPTVKFLLRIIMSLFNRGTNANYHENKYYNNISDII